MELKTVEKALDVLKQFADQDAPISTTELSQRMGVNLATMSRLLNTLNSSGFLERDLTTRRYQLGPAMSKMARAVHRSLDGKVTTVAIPYAKALRDEIGETIALEVISGNNLFHAYVANSLNPVSLRVEPGDKVMPHAHVGSKALIAFSPNDIIDYWLNQKLPHYTANTITEPDKVRDMWAEIRRTGIAYDFGEYVEEVNAIGAPIFNHENKAVAGIAIAVFSPDKKNTWKQYYIDRLRETANIISEKLHSSRRI